MRLNRRLNWRWTPARSCALGVALTMFVATLDLAGGLAQLEWFFYDWRALHFQYFTPPPIDRIVHLDIDDGSVETIGRWPWPRSTQAEIIDEVRLAGADVLALDIILAEPQEPTTALVGGTPVTTDHDALLASAIERFGRVLVPVSFGELISRRDHSPALDQATAVLRADVEMDEKAFAAKLPPASRQETADLLLAARRVVLSDRIREELSRDQRSSDAEIRNRVLPQMRNGLGDPSLAQQFEAQLRQQRSIVELRRFSVPKPSDCPPLLTGSEHQVLATFARAARYSGFVDVVSSEDGTVRGVPLWIEYGGRIYPQFDFAIACAALGADPTAATIERDRVSVPLPDGRIMVVPVRVRVGPDTRRAKSKTGAFFDIPWFGWTTIAQRIYDYPAYREAKQHVPIALAWQLAESRKPTVHNNAEATKSAAVFAADADRPLSAAAAFLNHTPPPDDIAAWLAKAEPLERTTTQLTASMEHEPTTSLTQEEQAFLNAARAIHGAVEQSRAFLEKAAELRRALSGKIVLVGSTSTAAQDTRKTSLHPECPGIVIHGVITHALLTGAAWRFAPAWVTAAITIGLGLLVTATVTWLPPLKALIGTILLAGTYGLLNTVVLFDYGDRIVGLAGPLMAATVVWAMLTLVRFVIERTERARITKKFRGYVDPQVVEYFIEHPEIERFEGQVREVTVCFTDLAGFTTMTERLRERAVPILGRYINRMVKVMRRHRGLMNRLMGDGIMFSYGAPKENPNHAADAVTTVLEMQEEMIGFNRELAEEGMPQLTVRGGVSTGNAVVGDSGGADASDFTCLGDTTNFGARLESANKYTGTKNLISARTAELIGDRFLLRPVALLQVAGKTQSVMTYEPLAASDRATDEQRRIAAMTREMVDHYQSARFADCRAAADALEQSFPASGKLAKLYRDTAARYEAAGAPPEGFRGEIVLTEK